MNSIVLEDKPVGFVNKNSLPAKNQKAHVKYLKKKKNKINNATDHSEMPEFNSISISEGVSSTLQNNYESKGEKYISDFKDIPLNKIAINSYKKDYKSLSHVRYGDNIDGCILLDGNTTVVGYVAVETKNNGQKWIQALEITKPYRGYKLSGQLLNLAVMHYGANYLSVNKGNQIAIRLYETNGWEKYSENDTMIFMKRINKVHEMTLLEAVSRKNMKPIFIVSSYTNSVFGNVINTYTRSEFNHSGLSFDTSLKKIFSFNAFNKTNLLGGFSEESIEEYLKEYKDAKINVRCIFVKVKDFDIVKAAVEDMKNTKEKTKYGYSNLLNILFNRASQMKDHDMSMVCSQFVAYVIQKANIDLVGKSTNLVTPKDLSTTNNSKIYTLYSGYIRDYKKEKIDRIFRKLRQKAVLIKECSL